MTKFPSIIMILCLSVSLVACGSTIHSCAKDSDTQADVSAAPVNEDKPETSTPTEAPTPKPTSEPTPEPTPEPIVPVNAFGEWREMNGVDAAAMKVITDETEQMFLSFISSEYADSAYMKFIPIMCLGEKDGVTCLLCNALSGAAGFGLSYYELFYISKYQEDGYPNIEKEASISMLDTETSSKWEESRIGEAEINWVAVDNNELNARDESILGQIESVANEMTIPVYRLAERNTDNSDERLCYLVLHKESEEAPYKVAMMFVSVLADKTVRVDNISFADLNYMLSNDPEVVSAGNS